VYIYIYLYQCHTVIVLAKENLQHSRYPIKHGYIYIFYKVQICHFLYCTSF